MKASSVDGIDFAALIRPGETVVVGQGCGEPTGLTAALVRQAAAIGPVPACQTRIGLQPVRRVAIDPVAALCVGDASLARSGPLHDARPVR